MEGMAIDPPFWSGRRVFLTGHTGFKGSWLSLLLQHLGSDLTGYALEPPTDPSLFELVQVGQGMRSVIGDVRDRAGLQTCLKDAKPEVVFHLAAQSLVRKSYADPVETYSANVMGTVHLLEGVRHVPGIQAVVVVTSDKCYRPEEPNQAHREPDPMGGRDPYSSSKGAAELVIAAYRDSFFQEGPAIASARAGNVIGGGDFAEDRLIPDIARAFALRQKVSIRNPQAVRPWQHVLEPDHGYLLLAQKLAAQGEAFASAWNFGPEAEDAKPVDWVVERAAELWPEGGGWLVDEGPHPAETQVLRLDCAKARRHLGWAPRWPLATALERTLEWYRAWAKGGDLRALTLQQMQSYRATEAAPAATR